MPSNLAKIAAAALVIAAAAPAAHAAERSIPAAADNTLFESAGGSLSNGAGPNLYAGLSGAGLRRALVRFDLSPAVPVGSTINSASLQLTLNNPEFGPWGACDLYRVAASWGEGDSNSGDPGGAGTQALPGDATWLHRFFDPTNPILWAASGGDFAANASGATPAASALGPVLYTGDGLRGDVQDWLDNAGSNFGWMIRRSDETALRSAIRYASRQHPSLPGPTLLVNFRAGGDANNDDRVNIGDFAILAGNFNQSLLGPDNGDFNRNGQVEIGDFSILAANFNLDLNPPGVAARPPAAPVPEPAGAIGLVLAASILYRRRRPGRREWTR
jgi:hypothetical protein